MSLKRKPPRAAAGASKPVPGVPVAAKTKKRPSARPAAKPARPKAKARDDLMAVMADALDYVADHTFCGADGEWHFKPKYDPQIVLDVLTGAPKR